MKPLVNYCRWHDASLRLRGRDDTAVWGQLVYRDKDGSETTQNFRYRLKTRQLTLEEVDGEKVILLDEIGVVIQN
ncbi:MAG TPA: hypothetical protein EYP41_19625 [Anaerolineae bacterium]|nr:hypothetical protein [Anaerolineae bacterium]